MFLINTSDFYLFLDGGDTWLFEILFNFVKNKPVLTCNDAGL